MRTLPTLLTACLLTTVAFAQSNEAQRLEQLLKQLAGTKSTTFQAQLRKLEAAAKAHEARARSLRAQAAAAASKGASARAELERLEKVMAALGKHAAPPKKVVAKKPTKKSPMKKKVVAGKTMAKKPPAMKSPTKRKAVAKQPAKRTPPKKAIAKKPTKKASPKKASPKKPSPKKPAAKRSIAKAMPMPMPMAPARAFVTYDDHVQEIFMTNCSACHDDEEKEGGLDLTSYSAALAGGSSGTTLVPGDIDQSRLYQLVAHLQTPTMPPDEPKIDQKLINTIRQWILDGAPENRAGAQAFLAKKQAAAPKAVAMKTAFDGPAAQPKSWSPLAARTTPRPVGVKSLATSPRSDLLAIPGDRQVFVFNSRTNLPIGILPFEHGDVEVLRFSADASKILVAGGTPGKRGRAVLYDVATGKIAGTFGREFDSVIAAAVHPQLTHIALGGSTKRVRVLDTATGKSVFEIKDHNDWILGLAFSSDGKFLVSVDRGGVVVLSEATSGRNVDVIRRHRGPVNAVAFAPNGQTYATVGDDRTLRLFSVKGARQITQRSTSSPATSVAYSADGKYLAVGCRDGRARTFRSNGSQITTLAPVGDWVYAVAFDRSATKLFVGDWKGATSVFDLKTHRRVAQLVPTAPRAQGQ